MTNVSTPGIVLFAHGARDPRWAAPFEAVAEQLRSLRPDARVRLAFLELMTPTLADAARALMAEGCASIEVVPLFLGAGGHVRKDLPALLDALRAQLPSVHITLHPVVGEMPQVIAALAAAAAATLATPRP